MKHLLDLKLPNDISTMIIGILIRDLEAQLDGYCYSDWDLLEIQSMRWRDNYNDILMEVDDLIIKHFDLTQKLKDQNIYNRRGAILYKNKKWHNLGD